MSERAPYSRVYWSIRRDEKFRGIYSDDHHLAAWLRLLIAADATWPAPADLPANARKASVKALSECGLIDLLGDGLFTVHGLDAERGRRREAASRGPLATQEGPKRDPDGPQVPPRAHTTTRVSRAELSQDETSRDEQRAPDAIGAFHQRTNDVPGPKLRPWINEMSEAHGESRVAAMFLATPLDGMTAPDYIKAVQNRLRLEDIAAERQEKRDEERRLEEKRRPIPIRPVEEPEISAEEADRIAREYMANAKAMP